MVDCPDLRQLGPVVGVLDAGGLDLEKGRGSIGILLRFGFVCLHWQVQVKGHDLEHLLVGRWAWEMSIGTGSCICSLGSFHGFFPSPRVFAHQLIIRWIEPTLLLIFAKLRFAPNFIYQLRKKRYPRFWERENIITSSSIVDIVSFREGRQAVSKNCLWGGGNFFQKNLPRSIVYNVL